MKQKIEERKKKKKKKKKHENRIGIRFFGFWNASERRPWWQAKATKNTLFQITDEQALKKQAISKSCNEPVVVDERVVLLEWHSAAQRTLEQRCDEPVEPLVNEHELAYIDPERIECGAPFAHRLVSENAALRDEQRARSAFLQQSFDA